MSRPTGVEISRVLSHALRHEPWLYELELDDEGWVSVEGVLSALRSEGRDWETLSLADLEETVRNASGGRHEIRAGRIRAVYGHSVPQRVLYEPTPPPAVLWHGTGRSAIRQILAEGLRPMERQYVHCSHDRAAAERVGRRKGPNVVLLRIDAERCAAAGQRFHRAGEHTWLCQFIPPDYLQVER